MAMTATLVKRHGFGIVEGIFTIVASGSYSTGGDSLDFAPVMGYTNKAPTWVDINGIAGYSYTYDLVNKKVLVFQTGAGSGTVAVTGTSDQPSFTVKSGSLGSNFTVGLSADSAAANFIGSTGVTTNRTLTTTSPVGTPTLTLLGTFTGTGSAAESQLPASSYPAGVTGDTITARVSWFM